MRFGKGYWEFFIVVSFFFSDDTELYTSLPSGHSEALLKLEIVENCCSEIEVWMENNTN